MTFQIQEISEAHYIE